MIPLLYGYRENGLLIKPGKGPEVKCEKLGYENCEEGGSTSLERIPEGNICALSASHDIVFTGDVNAE